MGEETNKVEIIESCMVVPDKETPKHRLWLSNLDLYNHKDHAPTFYLYKPHGNTNDFFSVDTLKKALGKTLVTFYPLAGRLAFDEDGRLEVVPSQDGEGGEDQPKAAANNIDAGLSLAVGEPEATPARQTARLRRRDQMVGGVPLPSSIAAS
ncbi:hypothetical protein J5N97_026967 [Dioscorea zingiberensis]|uniref:Shikimate O-hydroxycinnamoyltransferase n=1 Tax=Dioscorea zingiberensis TaxID=325984 RepID=A0A9D5C436_9LILI|nr:hypothetical protein J5N97_026967 [Dioscorea zingiberensis]